MGRFVLRFWPLILLVTLAASVSGIPPTIRLFKTISTDPIDLLPTDDPNVTTLREVRSKLERGVRSILVVESPDREANIRFVQDTALRLEKEPFVGRVEWKKAGYDFFDKNKLLFLDKQDLKTIRDRVQRKIQKEKLLGFYIDFEDSGEEEFTFDDLEEKYKSKYTRDVSSEFNESPNGHLFSFAVESPPGDTSLQKASRFHDALEGVVKTLNPVAFHPAMKVYLTGATRVLEYRALVADLAKVGIVSLLLICIPLLIRFRNIFHVLWVFLPLLVGMPMSFGVASFFVSKLNVCTSFLFAILGALGVENGIHIFSRYFETRSQGMPQLQALEEIYTKTGRAILTSVAAIAITFLAMLWNDFRGFSEFGLISGVGLWVIFASYFSFMPAMLVGLERFGWLRFRPTPEEAVSAAKSIPNSILTSALMAGLLMTLFSLGVTGSIPFEYDSQKTRSEIPSIIEAKAKQRLTMSRVNSPAALVIQGREEAEMLSAAVANIAQQDVLNPTVDTTKTYYDLVPPDQREKMKIIREIGRLLKDKTIRMLKKDVRKKVDRFREVIRKTRAFTQKDIPEELRHMFKGNAGSGEKEIFYINALPKLEMDDGRNAMRFVEDIGRIHTKSGIYYPASEAVVYGKMLQTMLSDAPRVMLVSLLLIIFFVFLDFRSVRRTAIVMTSILLGVLWMFGVMWTFDIRLNFYNMVIVPAVLGMSIDNSIHVFHRYQELGFGSIPRVLASSGRAALIASLTNASAFVGLLFCAHRGLFSIGLLALIGVVTCLISTLVFFPLSLQFLERVLLDRRRVYRGD